MEKKYTIELNETQLKTLEWVTELASRTICGQLDMLQDIAEGAFERDHKSEQYPHAIGSPEWYAMRQELEEHLDRIRKMCWGCDKQTLYGIGYSDKSDMLWDMHQVLRKFRYDHIFTDEERKQMRFTVLGDDPMRTSDEPLIKVRETNNN